MVVGASGGAAATFVQAIEGTQAAVRVQQDVVYGKRTILVPAGYLQHPRMVQSLIAIAQNNASHVVFVVEKGCAAAAGSPGLGTVFTCPVLGVVADAGSVLSATAHPAATVPDAGTEEAASFAELRRLGVSEPFFSVNLQSLCGMDAVLDALSGGRIGN